MEQERLTNFTSSWTELQSLLPLNSQQNGSEEAIEGKSLWNYQRLNREIRNYCKKAKEEWFNDQCTEIEVLEKQFSTKEMQKKVKQTRGQNTSGSSAGCIEDNNGNSLFDDEEIAQRWVEYVTELYDDDREPIHSFRHQPGKTSCQKKLNTLYT